MSEPKTISRVQCAFLLFLWGTTAGPVWAAEASADAPPPLATETKTDETPVQSDEESKKVEVLRNEIFQRRLVQGAPPSPGSTVTSTATTPLLETTLAALDGPPDTLESSILAASTPEPTPTASVSAPTMPAAPSQNVTINLINRLVQRGVLSKEDATELIAQAKEDAVIARAQAAAAPAPAPPPDDSVRVTYIPEIVRAQMREEIKQEVMAQAREENWAAPNAFPEWVSRFHLIGDVRFRYEGDFFPTGNATGLSSSFWNFNAINTGSPFDFTNPLVNPPFHNVDENRNRARLRARFGTEVDLTKGFTAGLRLATGENSSPVSTNQSLGAQGGNFSKYAIWLDRAFIKYELGNADKSLAVSVGRFDNPFFSTDMIWDDDLGFDGLALKGKYKVVEGVTPFLTVGAFPIFNTDFNFSSNQPTKFKSQDKWLYGVQLGTDWKISPDFNLKVAGAYYDFHDIEGRVSDPFIPLTAADAGSTDGTRPSFAQKGNTYIALREITPDASNGFGTTNQFQYFGLATPYRLGAFTTRLDIGSFDPFHIWLTGEVVKNFAFNENRINRRGPTNLLGPVNNNAPNGGGFEGGSIGGTLRLNLGQAVLEKPWDWNVNVGYRYVESDAVVDGFTDSDFGGGGTNLQGYTVGGNLAFTRHFWAGLRWLSADAIAGPTFKEDILQFDLNAKF